MKLWMIASGIVMLIAVGLFWAIAYDMHNHPERTYSVACAPNYFVKMFIVGHETFVVCGAPPYEEVTDFKIIKMP
jgi:hypothetical protein